MNVTRARRLHWIGLLLFTAPGLLGACCDPGNPKTIRERVWTDPIGHALGD